MKEKGLAHGLLKLCCELGQCFCWSMYADWQGGVTNLLTTPLYTPLPSPPPPPLPLAIIEWPTDWAQVRDIVLVSFMMKYGISTLSCLCQQKSHSFLYFFTCMQYYKIITDHKCASLATRQVKSDALYGPIPSLARVLGLDLSMSNLSTRALILETTIP